MRIKKILVSMLAACILICASGCSEADRVNYNISRQAEYFECERRVTVYNARTDKVIMLIEGYINIETDYENNELIVTAKVGASTYKKNYVYLTDYTLYVVDDISGTHTDPWHYKIYFDFKLPDIEVK
nr:MAG TPA: protein of unknown function (DUF5052) [Caudoviricetes sp.]